MKYQSEKNGSNYITTEELRAAADAALKLVGDRFGREYTLSATYIWDLLPNVRRNLAVEPAATVGNLQDDLDTIRRITLESEYINPYHLILIGNLIREIGEQLTVPDIFDGSAIKQ